MAAKKKAAAPAEKAAAKKARNSADVIVLGGGHNGLVAAAYLARAGIKTILLEARGELGGMALTAEAFDQEIPKGYIYAAMAFSLAVEALNIRARAKRKAQKSS